MSNLVRITDSINTDSSAIAASAKAVKTAYDLANGKADLDSSGKVPVSQLPDYVSDIFEYEKEDYFPVSGENGKIYIDKSTDKIYRWNGTIYIEISKTTSITMKTWTTADIGGV